GVGAVFPRALETYPYSTVRMLFEALKGERRSRNVAAHYSTTAALETLTVATVHRDGSVDVDAADFCEGPRTGAPHEAERTDELGGLAAGGRPEQLHVRRRRAVTRRKNWLVTCEGIYGIADAIEAPAMPLEHSEKTRVSPSRDLRDLLCAGLAELAKPQLALFVAHVHSIEGQRMKAHIELERAVGALHKRERTCLRISNRTQPKLTLRTPTQRTLQCVDERAEHVRAQLSVIAKNRGQCSLTSACRSVSSGRRGA
ncbi:MAG: hypothetical protein ACI9KE_004535, partial [Polyangiales bacterium]